MSQERILPEIAVCGYGDYFGFLRTVLIECLRDRGVAAASLQTCDPNYVSRIPNLWIVGNPLMYRRVWRCLSLLDRYRRPRTILWLGEALIPPSASSLQIRCGICWGHAVAGLLTLRHAMMPGTGDGCRQRSEDAIKLTVRELPRGAALYRWLLNPKALNYLFFMWIRTLKVRQLYNQLFVTGRSQQKFLAHHGIPASVLPFGWHPNWGTQLDLPRTRDVLFLGDMNTRRRRTAIQGLSRRLAQQGIGLDVQSPSPQGGRILGRARTEMLNSTKILLNILHYGSYEFPGMRFLLGMANGALVISEPLDDPYPFVPNVHYVSADLNGMPETIRHHLTEHSSRNRMVTRANQFVTQELTMQRAVATIMRKTA